LYYEVENTDVEGHDFVIRVGSPSVFFHYFRLFLGLYTACMIMIWLSYPRGLHYNCSGPVAEVVEEEIPAAEVAAPVEEVAAPVEETPVVEAEAPAEEVAAPVEETPVAEAEAPAEEAPAAEDENKTAE
jgi:hypothetical protein